MVGDKFFLFLICILLITGVSAQLKTGYEENNDLTVNLRRPIPDVNTTTGSQVFNKSEIWVTNLGELDDVNSTWFEGVMNVLTFKTTQLSLWLADSGFIPVEDINTNYLTINGSNAKENISIGQYSLDASWFNGKWNGTSPDDWIIMDGSSVEFNSSKLSTQFFNASTIEVITGTPQGAITDLRSYNGVSYNVSEDASDLELRVNFSVGVDGDFNQFIVRYKSTEEDEPHILQAQIYEPDGATWEDYGVIHAIGSYHVVSFPVFDADEHIDDIGVVQVRFYQDEGVPQKTHKHQFDWVALAKGFGVPSGEEVDPDFNSWLLAPIFTQDVNFSNKNIIHVETITARRLNVYSPDDDGAASIYVANAGDTDSYFRFQDQSDAIGNIIKTTLSGGSIIRLDPLPLDKASVATVALFRTTNTSEGVQLKLHIGDGTDTVGILLEADNGDITALGDFITEGDVTGDLATFTRTNIYSDSGSANIYLATEGDTTSYFRVYDNGNTQGKIDKITADGGGTSSILISPQPMDGTSSATVSLFRSTNTAGAVSFKLFKGDGSATETILLNAKTGLGGFGAVQVDDIGLNGDTIEITSGLTTTEINTAIGFSHQTLTSFALLNADELFVDNGWQIRWDDENLITSDNGELEIITNPLGAGDIIIDVSNGITNFSQGNVWIRDNLSAEDVQDRSWFFDKEVYGYSLDYVQDSSELKTNGKFDDGKLGLEKVVNYYRDKSRPVLNETSNKTYYPYYVNQTGRSISVAVGLHKQQIYDLTQENNLLKEMICTLDNCNNKFEHCGCPEL